MPLVGGSVQVCAGAPVASTKTTADGGSAATETRRRGLLIAIKAVSGVASTISVVLLGTAASRDRTRRGRLSPLASSSGEPDADRNERYRPNAFTAKPARK